MLLPFTLTGRFDAEIFCSWANAPWGRLVKQGMFDLYWYVDAVKDNDYLRGASLSTM